MNDLEDLYQEVILDHNRRPRNFRAMADEAMSQEGYNPLCGDRITVFLEMDGDVIKDVSFLGSGCAISQASASVMTTALVGRTRAQAEALFGDFQHMVTGDADTDEAAMGELAALGGVREYPTRVKCATLAWHAVIALLHGENKPASTE